MNPFDAAFAEDARPDYTDPAVRRDRLLAALMENAARAPKLGEKRVKLSEALFGADPESTGVDPAPKKDDLNAKAKRWLRAQGYTSFRVDTFDARFNRSHDLLGMFDYLAFGPGCTVGVQITTAANKAARRKKLLSAPALATIRQAGWKVLLLTFDKEGVGNEQWL